jgi:hypothetical protein
MTRTLAATVMPGLVPGIHEQRPRQDVDGLDEPGHDVDKHRHLTASCAGLPPASIVQRRWIAGSSPAMTWEARR